MDSGPALAITGATGALGGLVAAALADRGVPLRLLVRDTSRAPDLPGAAIHASSYNDAASARRALAGVNTLFMVSGAESADRVGEHRRFVDAAADAGVRHVVYTSFLGAAPDAVFTLARDHFHTEEHIKATAMQWTFLRDSMYMDSVVYFAGAERFIRGPAGDGSCSAVARSDVARIATAVLIEPAAHASRTYRVTGPASLTVAEIAAEISRATGRDVRYVEETVEAAYASREQYGAPRWQVDAWVSTYLAIARGEMAAVSNDIETVTGVAPISLREFLTRGPTENG